MDLQKELGIFQITAAHQDGTTVIVTYHYIRDWAAVIATVCDALGIERPNMDKSGSKITLTFASKQDAKTFAKFADREE